MLISTNWTEEGRSCASWEVSQCSLIALPRSSEASLSRLIA